MINLEQLASLIDQANLMQKSLYEMTPGEVEQIVQMVYECTSQIAATITSACRYRAI